MTRLFVIICALVANASCQRSERLEEQTLPALPAPTPSTAPSSPSPPMVLQQLPASEPLLAEDRVNTSGRDEGAAADIDQTAENEMAASRELAAPGEGSDRAITQRIRQTVVEDGSFSYSAKSIHIDTQNGVVTLSGPVRSNQERLHLTALARAMPGVKSVEDRMQIGGN